MSYVIYPQQDNKLAVLIPATCGLTIEEIAAKDVPAGTPYAIIEDLSSVDNDYFDGYIYSNGQAVPDIAKVKAIHLDKFRAARVPKLAALDIAFMRAVEAADAEKQAEIASQKQELRDVTNITLPDTIEEIKSVWPDILKA